ncbi:MAG: GNAT family N-acetyltransferase [Chloroflexi bacterium]|nr:GNAT family N-acetyltransferase [Chloroflexota bacterium]
MLEGLLVDLVPYDPQFRELEGKWWNGPAGFWNGVGDRPLMTAAQMARWMEGRMDDREQAERQAVGFGIQTKDGVRIGRISLNRVRYPHRIASMGAMIGDPDYWGSGYGTDAVLLAVDYAFDWLDMHKAVLMTLGTNQRVIRQAAKLGFTLEQTVRKVFLVDGAFEDGLRYGLLRAAWPGRETLIQQIGLRAR